jgi:hypothetical protein
VIFVTVRKWNVAANRPETQGKDNYPVVTNRGKSLDVHHFLSTRHLTNIELAEDLAGFSNLPGFAKT